MESRRDNYLYTTTSTTYGSEKDFRSMRSGWVKNIQSYNDKNAIKKNAFIEKFYQPYVNKMHYNISLNENISEIKKMTGQDAKINNYLEKKNKEVNKISHDLIIYNNPSIHFV